MCCRWFCAVVFILWLSSLGIAQSRPAGAKPTLPPKPAREAPLTEAEWNRVLVKAESVVRTALELPAPVRSAAIGTSHPVTRRGVVQGLDRLFAVVRPRMSFTPRPRVADLTRLSPETDATHQLRLKSMLQWGLMAPVGPITLGKRERYSVAEVGDALAYFLSRVAEITYTPTTRFTPYLMGEDPMPSGKTRSK